jgi:predicted DNA-binding transcriptional regulator AlpA
MNQTATLSPSHEERLIDFKETAHLLGDISERSVRRLIARGDLPQPVKVLSAPRLYRSEVFAYLEKLKAIFPSTLPTSALPASGLKRSCGKSSLNLWASCHRRPSARPRKRLWTSIWRISLLISKP